MYPWGKQKYESKQAYAAFRAYLEERSIRKTAQSLGCSRQLLERWSVKWRWVERAKAYHAHWERWNARMERVMAGLPPDPPEVEERMLAEIEAYIRESQESIDGCLQTQRR
jgi:hypothetical protein